MRLLSPILHQVVYPALETAGYFQSRASLRVSVITYHGVLPTGYRSVDPYLDGTLVSAASFQAQLRMLKKHYNVISPDRFLRWLRNDEELPTCAVLLTCDDGLLNNLTTMLPILQEEECKCLFFVTGGSLQDTPQLLWYVELYLMLKGARGGLAPIDWRGTLIPRIPADLGGRRAYWLQLLKILSRLDGEERRSFLDEATGWWGLDHAWKQRYLDDPLLRQRFQLLRAPELKQFASDAGITIGAHTLSHPILVEQSVELARTEIAHCRKAIETFLGKPVWAVAYPFGDPDSIGAREYGLAEAAGYECAFVNVGGTLERPSYRFSLPRIHVTAEMSMPVYEAYISGFHDRLQRLFRGGSNNRIQSNGRGSRIIVDNRRVYNRPDVAAHYAGLDYLTPCEELLFGRYIKSGAAVLDLGVGGGRTTPYLSRRASRYVGVDYASEMINACRYKYPGLEFLGAEASDLSALEECSFDAVVCAFNGLDYVTDEMRGRCFKECRRVLKPDGVLLFSSHNPRAILVRAVWNREHVRTAAEAVGKPDTLTGKAAFFLLNLAAGARAFLRAAWGSARRILARVPSRAFWRGEGYLLDSAHGGLMTHCWVPGRVVAEIQEQQFRLLKILGDDYPRASHEYVTDWYYYVFSRSNSTADGETCA